VEGNADLANPSSWQPVTGYSDILGNDQAVETTLPASVSLSFHHLSVRVESPQLHSRDA